MVDAGDLKSLASNGVWVQVPPRVLALFLLVQQHAFVCAECRLGSSACQITDHNNRVSRSDFLLFLVARAVGLERR